MKLYVTLNVSTFNFAFLVAHPFPDASLSVALLDLLYHITLFSFQGAGLPADRAGIKDSLLLRRNTAEWWR